VARQLTGRVYSGSGGSQKKRRCEGVRKCAQLTPGGAQMRTGAGTFSQRKSPLAVGRGGSLIYCLIPDCQIRLSPQRHGGHGEITVLVFISAISVSQGRLGLQRCRGSPCGCPIVIDIAFDPPERIPARGIPTTGQIKGLFHATTRRRDGATKILSWTLTKKRCVVAASREAKVSNFLAGEGQCSTQGLRGINSGSGPGPSWMT